jgi:hypothetical protein
LLRDRRHTTLYFARTKEYSQAPADSRRQVQHQPVLREMLGAGTPREPKNRAVNLVFKCFIDLCRTESRFSASASRIFALTDAFRAEAFYC